MTRYFFVILLMALIGIAIVVKAGITMFAERQYWQDVADRFVKENVTVKPNRGNIISSDGKLMASSLPGQECSPIQSTSQERTPGKKP